MINLLSFSKSLRLITLIWFLSQVVLCAGSGASEWFYRAWQTEDGLPDNSVSCVAQSPDGYLWMATNSGVVRFNGTEFSALPLRNIPGLPSRQARAMLMDRRGQLWLGMERGPVIRVSAESFRSFDESDDLCNKRALDMTDDSLGRHWIAYSGEVCRIEGGKVTRFEAEYGISRGRNVDIICDPDGQVWLATTNFFVFGFLGPNQDPATALISRLPQATPVGDFLTYQFTKPAGVSGITYGSEWSSTLGNDWQPVPDTATAPEHIFSVPIDGTEKFLRLRITPSPLGVRKLPCHSEDGVAVPLISVKRAEIPPPHVMSIFGDGKFQKEHARWFR